MDQATNTLGMKIYREDFGQTLGYWGVGQGFHIVLPLLGPSNPRDIIGLAGDFLLSPTDRLGHNTLEYKIPQNIGQAIASLLIISYIFGLKEYSFTLYHI